MTPRNNSVHNAFAILRLISTPGFDLSLAQMAERLGLSLAAVHRLVSTLQQEGAVVRAGRNAYMLAPGLAELGAQVDTTAVLYALAQAPVKRLVRRLGEVVHLGTFDGEMVTYLVKGKPRKKTISPTQEGTQLEAYSSGVGKALLAYLPDEELDRYLSGAPFVSFTDRTITAPDIMREALIEARDRGYAMDDEEVVPGLTCMAVPVLSHTGRAIASLSVSAESKNFTEAFKTEALASLKEEAKALSAALFGKQPDA